MLTNKQLKIGEKYGTNSLTIFNEMKIADFEGIRKDKKYSPQKHSCYIDDAFEDGKNIWFLRYSTLNGKQDKNGKWLNTVTKENNAIVKIKEDYLHDADDDYLLDHKGLEQDPNKPNRKYRLVFAKYNISGEYIFIGVFEITDELDENDFKKHHIYKLSKDKISFVEGN